ncbi:uncharacterized protein LDX57_002200 [Aspergillus melleus]|uniref:uncharacterized protein n=1 Tax=Aspergillus melleus TaxID=138277 RepID=UPI001E8EE0BE|nr:uncharacterized protein LDX57_002200 [Aspergillus melleus]KAH8424449.1 hypothetical protein LDX57_002200 [Aspergillus melleus]
MYSNTVVNINVHNAQLRAAASRFITVLKRTQALRELDGFEDAEIILIGGLAVTSHTNHRTTDVRTTHSTFPTILS